MTEKCPEQQLLNQAPSTDGFLPMSVSRFSPHTGGGGSQVVSGPASVSVAYVQENRQESGAHAAPRSLPADRAPFLAFRRLCEQILQEISSADDHIENGTVNDEGAGMIVEVEHLLERLYDCPWGEAECLKRIVVAIQAQLNNAVWKDQHILFLKDVITFLRVRFLINEAIVEMCLDMAEQHGLDEFRGGVSEPKVIKRYRLEEVTDA